MEKYVITAEINLKKIISESREVAQVLNELADNLERIEKKYAEPQESEGVKDGLCDEKECPNYVPKKYGKWIDRKNVVCLENVQWKYECSECGYEVQSKYNFCPNCLAKMREDDK